MCSRKWEANPYVVPSAEPRFFSGEGGGGTRGVYSKFQALGGAIIRSGALIWSSALKILTHWDQGDSHITGTARSTVTIKPLNEINLGMAQDFFDKGDHISSNTVWQCLFLISRYFLTQWGWDWLKSSLALRDIIGTNIGFLSWAH